MRKTMYIPNDSHPCVIKPDDVISIKAELHHDIAVLGSLSLQA
jgi:hypothetical protein